MVPPSDSDHGCEWRDFAQHLSGEVDSLKAEVAALRRAFGKRSEKRPKMPPISRPPKVAAQTLAERRALAVLRSERVETQHHSVRVPDADKKCHLCGGTMFRTVGDGKECSIYEYVPGYLRRTVLHRETVACRCGGCVLTAPAPAEPVNESETPGC